MDLAEVAFLFDVDNTLLDNDRVKADLVATTERLVGPQRGARFWEVYEDVRRDFDHVDLPQTLRRYSREFPDERNFPELSDAVLSYPYRSALFPGALEVLQHAAAVAAVAILSDGDPVYQPAKIARAGISGAIDGPVLVFDHKEDHLEELQRRVPARRYVMIDDKPRILAAMTDRLGERVITVHVCQGRYSHDEEHAVVDDADHTVDVIAGLLDLDLADLARPPS